MPGVFNNQDVIEMCQILAEQEQLTVAVQESLKAGLIAGFGAAVGGILGGPIGIAIGGTFGSAASAWCSLGKFRSVVDILRNDLTVSQQRRLVAHVQAVLSQVKHEHCISLITLVLTTTSLKELVIKELGSFLLKELNLKMVQ